MALHIKIATEMTNIVINCVLFLKPIFNFKLMKNSHFVSLLNRLDTVIACVFCIGVKLCRPKITALNKKRSG